MLLDTSAMSPPPSVNDVEILMNLIALTTMCSLLACMALILQEADGDPRQNCADVDAIQLILDASSSV